MAFRHRWTEGEGEEKDYKEKEGRRVKEKGERSKEKDQEHAFATCLKRNVTNTQFKGTRVPF